MSGAEEYLDGLLHSVEGGSPADTARETEPGDTAALCRKRTGDKKSWYE